MQINSPVELIMEFNTETKCVQHNDGFNTLLKASVTHTEPARKQPLQLIQGDCLTAMKAIPSDSVHLVLTDPPYFLDGLDSDWKKGNQKTSKNTGSVGGLPVGMKFDKKQGIALQEFMNAVAIEWHRILVSGGFVLSFSQPRLSHRMAVGIDDAGFEIRDIYAWRFTQRAQFKAFSQDHFVKKRGLSQKKERQIIRDLAGRKTPQLRPQYESIIMAQKPRKGTFVDNWLQYRAGLIDATKTLDGYVPSTVMTVEKPDSAEREPSNHLTPKPIKLLNHLIEVFTEKGQTVLDPFLGSGSTAIASMKTGRSCIGIEINDDYMNMAKQRLDIINGRN